MYFGPILPMLLGKKQIQAGRILTLRIQANGVVCWLENIFLIKVNDSISILYKKFPKQKKLKCRREENVEMFRNDPLEKVTRTWECPHNTSSYFFK